MPVITTITKLFEFEAAHFLPVHLGKCQNLHGHTYKLEIEIFGSVDPETGMIMDFGNLKAIIKQEVLVFLDHTNLNDFFVKEFIPTAENVARWIYEQVDNIYKGNVVRVRLWETSISFAEVKYVKN